MKTFGGLVCAENKIAGITTIKLIAARILLDFILVMPHLSKAI
jgi:hypothetical protein